MLAAQKQQACTSLHATPVAVDGGKVAYHAITGGFVLQRVLDRYAADGLTPVAACELEYYLVDL